MKPKAFETWTKTRQLGRHRYIWIHSVLTWSVLLFLIFAVQQRLLGSTPLTMLWILFLAAWSIFAAAMIGALNWSYKEAQFVKEEIRREATLTGHPIDHS